MPSCRSRVVLMSTANVNRSFCVNFIFVGSPRSSQSVTRRRAVLPESIAKEQIRALMTPLEFVRKILHTTLEFTRRIIPISPHCEIVEAES